MGSSARHVCLGCGAEYVGHAEYCNACGSEQFDRIGGGSEPARRLRSDGTVLVVQGVLWLVALVYLLGERGVRHPIDVFWAWAFASAASLAAGLVTRHLRAALVFIVLGGMFALVAVGVRG